MKYTFLKINALLLCCIFIFLNSSCEHDHSGHDHEDHAGHDHGEVAIQEEEDPHAGHDHGDEVGHDDHDDHGEIIELNEAQFENAGITLGWFTDKNLSDVIQVNGRTAVSPRAKAAVSMPINGTLKTLHLIEGDYVKKGQAIATMQSLEFNKMLLEKAKLKETLNVSKAGIPYLQEEYNRQQKLSQENVNAKKIFQKVSSDLQVEQARIEAIKEQIQILDQTVQSVSDQANPNIEIFAPISGYLTEANVQIGSAVIAGDHLFSIVNNANMHVDLSVYEKDLGKIKIGQKIRFTITNQSNDEITGKIYRIGKQFDEASKTVTIHAEIDGKNKKLIPGMYVSALVDLGTTKVSALPKEAVVMAEGRAFIFLWEKENLDAQGKEKEGHDGEAHTTFARLEVKTGASKLGFIEVTPLETIHEGDKIVTKGAYYIQSHLQKSEGGGGHSH